MKNVRPDVIVRGVATPPLTFTWLLVLSVSVPLDGMCTGDAANFGR